MPASEIRDVEVGADQHGARLDMFLASALPDRSRSQIQKLIKEGRIAGPTTPLRPSTPVRAGQRFRIEIPEPVAAAIAPEDIPLHVLYEDADLVVLDKPAGMVVHPGAGHTEGTLVSALLYHVEDLSGIGGELRPGIVHRLDRGTSGVMVAAKNDRAHQELARQFHDREVEKEYIALVWGVVQAGRRIDAPIGRDPGDRQKMSTRARRARSAVTRITKAEHL
jgi:23S rRNA pseudouridine1911/1915/1917 synthase